MKIKRKARTWQWLRDKIWGKKRKIHLLSVCNKRWRCELLHLKFGRSTRFAMLGRSPRGLWRENEREKERGEKIIGSQRGDEMEGERVWKRVRVRGRRWTGGKDMVKSKKKGTLRIVSASVLCRWFRIWNEKRLWTQNCTNEKIQTFCDYYYFLNMTKKKQQQQNEIILVFEKSSTG